MCYLSPILDVCTHEVLAYSLSDSLRVDFVLDMVDDMCSRYWAELDDTTIVHSDQGCHYTSKYTYIFSRSKRKFLLRSYILFPF